jgi:hypothetical protein
MRKARCEAAADWIGNVDEYDRNCLCLAGKRAGHRCGLIEDRVGPQIDQLFCQRLDSIQISGAPPKFNSEITAFRPPQLRERIPECCNPSLRGRIAFRKAHQYADPPHALASLRARDGRQGKCRAADQGNEFPPPHELSPGPRITKPA